MTEDTRIELAGVERIDEVRELWLALHDHHTKVAALQPLVKDVRASWQRRRALYLDALTPSEGFLVIATRAGRAVGYAMVRLERGPDDTWPVGDRYAELYSLSVARDARGHGIGTRILDFVDRTLADRGIRDLQVAVMVGNDDARRFYERRGLRAGEINLYRFAAHA